MRARTLLVASLLLLAGCLGSTEEPAPRNGTDDRPVGSGPTPKLPSWFLTGSMGLTQDAPTSEEPDRVRMGSFYANWTTGGEQPTWTGAPLPNALRLTEVQLTFYYTADEGAVATTGPADQGFPEFVVYVGTEQAPMAWASVSGPDVVQEEDIIQISSRLSLPEGGLVLPAGVQPVVKIAPVQGQLDQRSELVLLTNSTQTPSRVTMTGEPITLPPSGNETVLDTQGTLAGSAYVTGPQEGTTAANHTVQMPQGALGLVATLERGQGAGVADIDLEVIGPDGQVVARSVTPEDDEGIALYQPNVEAIGPGTWTLRVVNYGNAAVQYQITAERLTPIQAA